MIESGENFMKQSGCEDFGVVMKKLVELTHEIDEMRESLWMNEAKISVLVQRGEMYRSALESGSDEYICSVFNRELLRDKLRHANNCDKIELTKEIVSLGVEIDAFEGWSDRVEKTSEDVEGEINRLRGDSSELLKRLPSQVGDRETLFRRCLDFNKTCNSNGIPD
jgi:hypothetical protein